MPQLDPTDLKCRRLLRRVRCVLIANLLMWCANVARAAESVAQFRGSFELREALTYYVVNPTGAAFSIQAEWSDPYQPQMDRPLLIRVFDPEEHVILRHDEPGERTSSDAPAPQHVIDLQVPASGAGVYQVAVSAFGGSFELTTEPPLSWGVFGAPKLISHGDVFAKSFIFLPPGLDALQVRCEGQIEHLTLKDESGQSLVNAASGAGAFGQTALPTDGEHIWEFSVKAPGEFKLNFAGMPIILCPDAATARAIHASVDVLEDGTICFHKFQVRAHAILKRYRAMDRAMFGVKLPILIRYKAAWLADPVRHQLLVGPYGVYSAMPAVLREQNLDPQSPWFGTIHAWRSFAKQMPQPNPWASYSRLGLSRVSDPVAVLAAVYSINEPFNPLHKDAALRNCIIIAALQDLMMLREHEFLTAEIDEYQGGVRAFSFARFTHAFPLVVRDCPADVREVWTEGLRRYVDRQTISQVADPVNQWTFIINGIQHFADGSGEPWYGDIVKRHLRWLLTRNQWNFGWSRAGYFNEAEGPDATYNGLTNQNLAWLYKQTGHRPLLDALRACMNLFNHTVAPEPDGSWLGASSFCHRTPGDWIAPQHGAGLSMLADEAPEALAGPARVWDQAAPARTPAQVQAATNKLLNQLVYMDQAAFTSPTIGLYQLGDSAEISFSVWQHFASAAMTGSLPMVAENHFTRNFGDEFFAVRRPRYFAFLFAGHSMGEWKKSRRPPDAHHQYPQNGGGLCMFWSPGLGSSVLAKNWSAYSASTLIAERGDAGGEAGSDWEDYWSVRPILDESKAEATITGSIRDQPLEFARRYRFLEDQIVCDVHIHALKDAKLKAMWECFPYPLDKPDPLQVSLLDEHASIINDNRPASAIRFGNRSGEVHLVVFALPRRCVIGVERSRDDYQHDREYGRVLAAIEATWQPDQKRDLRWSIMAGPNDQVPVMMQKALAAMQE